MTLPFTLVLFVIGAVAGLVGSMTGLGGAVVVLPVLSIFMGVPVQYAAGAALVSTIATSSGAASRFVRDRITNIRIGMSLEIGTTMGAIVGALLAAFVYAHGLARLILIIFGVALLLSVYAIFSRKSRKRADTGDWSTRLFRLRGSYYDKADRKSVGYTGVRWWFGEIVMFCAGILSGLLGIGSGVLKVLGMDSAMHLPVKVSTATSDFMIGVTAVTGSGVYLALGYIDFQLVAPVLIGVALGSYFGSRAMEAESSRKIMLIFMGALVVIAIELVLRGLGVA